jgi:hypothetical protein
VPLERGWLRLLEEENGKLKTIVADLSLDKAMIPRRDPPKALKPARQRQTVDQTRSTWRVSINLPLPLPSSRASSIDRTYQGERGQGGVAHSPITFG